MTSAPMQLSVFLLGIFFLISPKSAEAAFLYFDPDIAEVYRGDTVTLSLRIDTDEGECINTVDAVIKYDDAIRAVDVTRGDSILNIWVENPVINEENHTITFAGGLPGGYCGRIAGDPRLTNVVAEFVFRSPGLSIGGGNNTSAKVWIDETSQVLLHDGLGTKASLHTEGALITLLDSAGGKIEDSWSNRVQDDTIPPSDFSIALSKEETAFSGNYFISFNSQDKQSGIDHYEVMEEPFEDFYAFKWGGIDAPWTSTESPYVLKDQTLNSTIRVKAIDKAGNETVAVLVPEAALRSMSTDRLITLVLVGVGVLIFAIFLTYGLWRRKQKLIEAYDHTTNE